MLLSIAVLLAASQLVPPPQEPAAAPAPSAAVQPLIERGIALYWQRRFGPARVEFQKAVEADPSSAAAHYFLGYALYKISEPTRRLTPEKQQALEQFGKCFELEPGFTPDWRRK